jgi:hypothetical protein
MRRLASPALALLAVACSDRSSASSDTGTDTDGDPSPSAISLFASREVDILFVIDNSESMGRAQGRLAAAMPALLDVLEDPDYPINYRVAVTTTDMGNPACGDTSPESGALQIASCRSRLGEFALDGEPAIDAVAIGCTDVCSVDSIETTPTTTSFDATPRSRPWIENIEGRSNLAPGINPRDALPCIVPQGIAGCGFESPLEAMYRAIERAGDPVDPQHGFLRASATFAVVVMTDEVDCSYNPEFESVFLAEIDGGTSPVFWSDPEAAAPTSAVCWNAGILCEGDGMPYDGCRPSNKNTAGFEDIPSPDAVLHPVGRYIDALNDVEQMQILSRKHVVAFIDGVPPDYDGELVYAVSTDEADQIEYGIGPGCTFDDDGEPSTPELAARPPVREVELAERFAAGGETHLHSICQADFSATLASIAESIREQHPPICMSACVADTDPEAAGLQPQCSLTEAVPNVAEGGVDLVDVPECLAGGTLPADATLCYELRVDDALAPRCADDGWNLELRLVRAPGVQATEGWSLEATCEYSQNREVDCPNLP